MKRADHLIQFIVLLARIGAGVSFAVLIGTVLIQVVGRFIGSSPVWTEELTRYALLFSAAFGAGLSFRTGDLVNVDVICEALPGRAPWVLRLFAAIVTAGLAIYLLPHAWKYVSIGKMQTAPALGIKMHYVHFTVWLMLALLAVFASLRVLGMLTGTEDGKPRKPEED
ncbi:TRAP-type C4-dicarboxylate transport system permease small subunit [Primorskyibacter sedentarius]|uniref:TRAP transporter small permease protein n=1 Tax=Primorskyibacter sedentarius TaxID=745311 RepID=A0A4V2UP00_9RHOB|nr:TRAP transporter small permease [Primorskyibacter sedentarius]TCS63901.1 TRAP-type C4-dicarboxylate transport system permease small subunit [Primorskyibacter sedentarius]